MDIQEASKALLDAGDKHTSLAAFDAEAQSIFMAVGLRYPTVSEVIESITKAMELMGYSDGEIMEILGLANVVLAKMTQEKNDGERSQPSAE